MATAGASQPDASLDDDAPRNAESASHWDDSVVTTGRVTVPENVTMTQTSGATWEVRVSGTERVVGSIRQLGDRFSATSVDGTERGEYDSPELAMFGVVSDRLL